MDTIIQIMKSIFGSATNMSVFISGIATLIAAISAMVAIIGNRRNQKHYHHSILPQLSMKLVEYDYQLFLYIKNTGKTPAKDIRVIPRFIECNGDRGLEAGKLFDSPFELYPEEAVQDVVAYFGSNIAYTAFPKVTIDVSYSVGNSKREIAYSRTITYYTAYNSKISADVNIDTDKIEQNLGCISRAVLRTANYLDGRQVAPFDSINVTTNKSLEGDLQKTLGQAVSLTVSREEAIKEFLGKQTESFSTQPAEQ